MIHVFETASGSTYEIDREAKRIRRVSGATPTHRSFGTDGWWQPYEDISQPVIGQSVFVLWSTATSKTTITSRVTRAFARLEGGA